MMFPMYGITINRDHSLQERDQPFRREIRRYSSNQKVVSLKNSLPKQKAQSLTTIIPEINNLSNIKTIKEYVVNEGK